MRYLICVVAIVLIVSRSARGQSPNATLNGQVVDSSGGSIAGANIDAVNVATNVKYSTKTNAEGMYLLPDLPPATYEIQVSHAGFKTIVKPDVLLNVRDAVVINFTLPLGAVSERVTVEGGAPLINTESAAVSTVIDRNFAENLPMNGRSFQTLIQLTPGVVLTTTTTQDGGQFSVNGQRAASNYWMVDGVGANIGIASQNSGSVGNGLSGSLASFSALGGTSSLVSVDAMQEFRIQTSSYAPEFGRTPGGQISIATRSGTNQFHGTGFDYFRNDVLDANDWFANSKGLPKPRERQNDFGGTFSGPIFKNKTFFFFSYEGLRLRLPQTALTTVPCDSTCTVFGNAHAMAVPAMQPFLNAFPLPNGPEVFTPCTPNVNGCPASGKRPTGSAQFNASYSNSASLDASSLRLDHKLNNKVTLFGRYNYSPSDLTQRGILNGGLSSVVPSQITTQTVTAGLTWALAPTIVNDFRFNYSRTASSSFAYLDSFDGAVPLSALPFPSAFTSTNADFALVLLSANGLLSGELGNNLQRQINVVDNVSVQRSTHNLKFGVDFRRLSPHFGNPSYFQQPIFLNVASLQKGNPLLTAVISNVSADVFLHNLGAFAQDTWRVHPRLTLTYGLRWDVDFAPSSNPEPAAATGFNVNDLSTLALAPAGTPPFNTKYGNVAPRVGIAYQLLPTQRWQSVLRGGFGIFYDLATSELGNDLATSPYPFGAAKAVFGAFPLDPTSAAATPPPIIPANLTPAGGAGALHAFDPNLKLPYSYEWNVSFEQALGQKQALSASYVGSSGRRLFQTTFARPANSNLGAAQLIANAATSDYDALQIQFERRLSGGLQALASYTWSHSIDSASAASLFGNSANVLVPGGSNRGPSDFDIRHAFSAGLTYDVPVHKTNSIGDAILRGWSIENIVQTRSAPPVTPLESSLTLLGFSGDVRPDLVPGIPLYLFGPQYPGGKIFNNTPNQGGPGCLGPYCPPPKGSNGAPLRQGNMPRNLLRGFGAAQWDFAVHRGVRILESLKLEFRAEMFNVLNHPNFGPPLGNLSNSTQFGRSLQILGRSFASGNSLGSGGFSPLYQIGGPRSIQLALKLRF